MNVDDELRALRAKAKPLWRKYSFYVWMAAAFLAGILAHMGAAG